MTDKQQIEKFATDLCKACSLKTCKSEYPPCVKAQWVSEALYNAGYRKVDENAVVLTQEEYHALMLEQKRLKKIVDEIPCGYGLKDEIRKETIKAFLFLVKSYLACHDINGTFTIKELLTILAKVARELFGVEVDE